MGALLALLVARPATAADEGLAVLAAPAASGGTMQLQVEVRDPALQQDLSSQGASAARFRVVVDEAGAQVTSVRRMRDAGEGGYTVLAFDQSKSFAPYWPQAFALAREYADALGARSEPHTVAVMAFGVRKATVCEESTGAAVSACLARAEQLGALQNATRLKFYIREAAGEAARKLPLSQGGSREVIVFTDAGEESDALSVKQVSAEAHALGVRLHVVAFSGKGTGKGVARRLDDMAQLAGDSGGRYIQVEDGDARKALVGLVEALEHLYWLDVSFCGVKPGTTTGRLSAEALLGGKRTAWSSPVSFRQSAEGTATTPCTPGTSAPPGAQNPSTGPGTVTGPATTPGASSPTGAQGSSAGSADAGPPWGLIALALLVVLGLVVALVLALSRRNAPAPAPLPVAPVVAAPPAVAAPAPPSPPLASGAAQPWKDPFATLPETRLVVSKGPPGLEPFYRVHKSPFTVGARRGEVDLAIELPQLSGHHATLQLFKMGNVFIQDERSTNGTFVEGRRLSPGERVQVKPGQVIRLSQHLELTLVQPGLQPAEPAPAGAPLVEAPSAPSAEPPAAPEARVKPKTLYAPVRGGDDE
jgi:pSer/pThr/pTyr-binding forkhead associated (FHA) protein